MEGRAVEILDAEIARLEDDLAALSEARRVIAERAAREAEVLGKKTVGGEAVGGKSARDAAKRKRTSRYGAQRCGICGKLGHNRRGCPGG